MSISKKKIQKLLHIEEGNIFKAKYFGNELINQGDSAAGFWNEEKNNISLKYTSFKTSVPQLTYCNHKFIKSYNDFYLVKSKTVKVWAFLKSQKLRMVVSNRFRKYRDAYSNS